MYKTSRIQRCYQAKPMQKAALKAVQRTPLLCVMSSICTPYAARHEKNKLVRCRIHNAINAYRHDPVLYVSAPMGYGKSIAVRHYLAEQVLDNIWVSALHDDDMRVWKNICEAISSKRVEAGRKLQAIGFPVASYLIPQIIEAFKLVAREPLVIVIDDCHLLAGDSLIYHILFALAMEHIIGLRII